MNKTTLLVWNGILTIAVGVLSYFVFAKPSAATTENARTSVSDTASGQKIVYVHIDSLLNSYEYFKEVRKEMENARYQLDYQINTKGKSLQNEIAFFQEKAGTMTMEQAKRTEAQLMKKQQDFVEYREKEAQKIVEQEGKKNEELYKKIHDYIDKYNSENAYQFVLGYSQGGGILFAENTLDVTKDVLAGLNKEYVSSVKKEAPAKKPAKK